MLRLGCCAPHHASAPLPPSRHSGRSLEGFIPKSLKDFEEYGRLVAGVHLLPHAKSSHYKARFCFCSSLLGCCPLPVAVGLARPPGGGRAPAAACHLKVRTECPFCMLLRTPAKCWAAVRSLQPHARSPHYKARRRAVLPACSCRPLGGCPLLLWASLQLLQRATAAPMHQNGCWRLIDKHSWLLH